MNTHDVEALIAVIETGSIVGASARLHLTQPGVTRRVQNLEQALGVELLDRQSRPLRPTAAGRDAYEWGRRVVRSVEDMAARFATAGDPASEIRIGIAPALSDLALRTPVDRLRAAHPKLQLRFSAAWSIPLLARVRSAELDAAAVTLVDGEESTGDLAATALGTGRVLVVASVDADIPARPSLDDLAGFPWVVHPDGCSFRALVRDTMLATRLPFEVGGEAFGPELQLSLVARGVGLGLISDHNLAASPQRRSVRVISIRGFRPRARYWLVRRPALGRLDDAVETFGDALAAELRRRQGALGRGSDA